MAMLTVMVRHNMCEVHPNITVKCIDSNLSHLIDKLII